MPIETVPVRRSRLFAILTVPLACAIAAGVWLVRPANPAKTSDVTNAEQPSVDEPNQHRIGGGEPHAAQAPLAGTRANDPPAGATRGGAPEIESPDVIASMDIEFVAEEVKRMDKELLDRNAVERLNSGEATDAERLEFGALMHRIALFRHRLLEDSVESLQKDVEEYSQGHAERLAKYSKKVIRR
jgi:hypothetical protein